jgi:hypothetical protein
MTCWLYEGVHIRKQPRLTFGPTEAMDQPDGYVLRQNDGDGRLCHLSEVAGRAGYVRSWRRSGRYGVARRLPERTKTLIARSLPTRAPP